MKGGAYFYRAFFIYEETFILHFNTGPPKEYRFTHIQAISKPSL